MIRTFIGLGANLGADLNGMRSTLLDALDLLAAAPGTTLVARSLFYQTAPVDAGGPDYLNAVAAFDTTLDAPSLLAVCLAIERGIECGDGVEVVRPARIDRGGLVER